MCLRCVRPRRLHFVKKRKNPVAQLIEKKHSSEMKQGKQKTFFYFVEMQVTFGCVGTSGEGVQEK
jgi:hypothetical protein